MKAIEIYKPPFKSDGVYIWTADNVMALMNISEYHNPDEMMHRLTAILNDEIKPATNRIYDYSAPEILLDGKPLFVVRGWGHLTGIGGLNLSPKDAAAIQDLFAHWVISKLQGILA